MSVLTRYDYADAIIHPDGQVSPAGMHPRADGAYYLAADADAAIAEKDELIADLSAAVQNYLRCFECGQDPLHHAEGCTARTAKCVVADLEAALTERDAEIERLRKERYDWESAATHWQGFARSLESDNPNPTINALRAENEELRERVGALTSLAEEHADTIDELTKLRGLSMAVVRLEDDLPDNPYTTPATHKFKRAVHELRAALGDEG